MHFFKAFKQNLANFKSPYVKRCEPVLGINKKAPVRRIFEPEAFHFYFVDSILGRVGFSL